MGGYVMNFAVYTMAMIGLIFFALMVYKKCAIGGTIKNSHTKMLNIEETITIAPRKTLYIVRAGSERFLIAGDVDKTTLISKLDKNNVPVKAASSKTHNAKNPEGTNSANATITKPEEKQTETITDELEKLYQKRNSSIDDLPVIVDFQKKAQEKNVLHNMLKKINE